MSLTQALQHMGNQGMGPSRINEANTGIGGESFVSTRRTDPAIGDKIARDFKRLAARVSGIDNSGILPAGLKKSSLESGNLRPQRNSGQPRKESISDIVLDSIDIMNKLNEEQMYFAALVSAAQTGIGSLKRLQQG